jgi:subtilisin family serine protease
VPWRRRGGDDGSAGRHPAPPDRVTTVLMSTHSPRRALLALTVALCVGLPLGAPAVAGAQTAPETVDLIVRRDPGLDASERAEVRAAAGVSFDRRLRLADTEVVTVPAAQADAALSALRASPGVRWVQRDGVARAQSTGPDTYFDQLWGLHNTGQEVDGTWGTPDADMDVPEAWEQSTGSGVTVAVVDTGVDAEHPDLAGQIATNPGEMGPGRESDGEDDDHDGLVDNWRGYDFAADDNDPSDANGHGTHVAGTIAAVRDNDEGISGVAPDAMVLVLRALGDDGTGDWSAVADAFDYAGDLGVPVVNASLGGPGEMQVVSDAIAEHPNTLYVVAAGNDARNLNVDTYTPCQVPQPNVLCVGASDSNDAKAGFSNFSPLAVDVFAPGVNVLSTRLGTYWYNSGTSMATPHVAGEAALLLARHPSLSAGQIKQAILDSAEPKDALEAYGHGGGRANAAAAVALFDAGDGDADGHADTDDDCPSVADADQRDTDGDGAGDACDLTPRGPDSDHDGVVDMDDPCPFASGPLGGCPVPPSEPVAPVAGAPGGAPIGPPPVPPAPVAPAPVAAPLSTPRVGAVKAVAAGRATCRAGRCTRTVTVAATLAPGTRITGLVAQVRACRRGRCTWRTAARSATTKVKLPAGRYRLTVTASGPGGRVSKAVSVTVRGR